jgi:hypothetical protein
MTRRIPSPPTTGHVVIVRQVERPGHKAEWDYDEKRWALVPQFVSCEDDIASIEGDEATALRYKRAGDKVTVSGRTFWVKRDAAETYDFNRWITWTVLEVVPYYATEAEAEAELAALKAEMNA